MSTIKTETLSTPSNATVPVDTVVNGTAKAWVNFNGQGTVAIRRAFNVSSVTDNGTGDYTVTLAVAMPDTSWAPVITHRDAIYEGMSAIHGDPLTTTTVRIAVHQGHVTVPPRQDTSLVTMVAFS